MKLIRAVLLIGLFLFIGKASFSQDTTTVTSHFQRFNLGKDTKTDSVEYVLSFYKDKEEKVLTITRSSDKAVTKIIGDEMTDFDQKEDTLMFYFNGREVSPVKFDIKLAVIQKAEDVILVGMATPEGTIFFFTDKPIATKPK